MPAVNELLTDAATSHAVDLAQVETGIVRRMIALLNRVDADLADALSRALDRLAPEAFTVERLEALLGSVRKLNAQAYDRINKEMTATVRDLSTYESSYQAQSFRSILPKAIQAEFRVASINANQVYSAALARPFQGRLLSSWVSTLADGRMDLVRNAIRIGYVESQTTADIVRRIRGTRANAYADGLLNRPRRELESVIRTALSHTAEVARENFRAANQDIIGAVFWHATLDTKTTEICRVRDRLKYTADQKHKPIGHSVPWLQGPGRSHWQCRSSSVPITKSWRELGFDINELDAGTRASMDGQVPGELSYGDWLQRQSAARQDEVVGPTRGRLMREGKLPFDRLYNNRGQWLDLEELKSRDAASFSRAGL